MKLYRIMALMLGLLLCVALFAACDEESEVPNEPCTSHTDADSNGACDTCGAAVPVPPTPCATHTDANGDQICDVCEKTIPVAKIEYTITLTDEAGAPMAGIEIALYQDEEEVALATTDAAGQIKGSLVAGDYQLVIGELPQYWYSGANYSTLSISGENKTFTLVAIDNSPNGSAEKPFPAEDAATGTSASMTFAQGEQFYFATKGVSRYLVIRNAHAKVHYQDVTYTPDENDVIRILLDASEMYANTVFIVENTADGANTIALEFESIPGTLGSPFAATLNTEYTATVPAGSAVYYKLVASQSGYLILTSPSTTNDIILYNTTTMAVSDSTNGALTGYVFVNENDEILLTVSTLLEAPADETLPVPEDEILFTLTISDEIA